MALTARIRARFWFFGGIAAIFLAHHTVAAETHSKAARWLMKQQGEVRRGNPKGKFDPASAVERYLTATVRLISFSIIVVCTAKPTT